jgi:hypothetical protein
MHLNRRLQAAPKFFLAGAIVSLVSAFCGDLSAANEPTRISSEQLTQQAQIPGCTPEAFAKFEGFKGDPVDIDALPRGYFLYSEADFLVESSSDKGAFSAVVRETPARSHKEKIKAEISCADHIASLGSDFTFAMTGLVKITNTFGHPEIELTQRQYSIAKDAQHLQAVAMKVSNSAESLKSFMQAQGSQSRLLKTGDRTYELHLVNDRVKSRGDLLIKFDFTPEI